MAQSRVKVMKRAAGTDDEEVEMTSGWEESGSERNQAMSLCILPPLAKMPGCTNP